MKKIYHHFPDELVQKPGYDISHISTGIVHLGFGAFHRAHQALYTDEAMSVTGRTDWGIAVASLRSGEKLINQLRKQDYWYTVNEWDENNQRQIKLVGAVIEALAARDDRHPLLDLMSKPSTRIVTLTITEKGYCLDPTLTFLNSDDEQIKYDLAHPKHPTTAPGLIVEALARRRQAGVPPFTVLSCDNLPDNGNVIRQAVIQMAATINPELSGWIEQHVSFPSSLVDRIVPAVTEKDLDSVCAYLGAEDLCTVICEPFRQWIIEDNFPLGRPKWDLIDGAKFVEDVAPWQAMKLQMLNGCHSLLAYLGVIAGYETIAETLNDDRFLFVARQYLNCEATARLRIPEGVCLDDYGCQILRRFSNPTLKHRTDQVANDGSVKLPVRWFAQFESLVASQSSFNCIALGVAAWFHYLKGVNHQGNSIQVNDPQKEFLNQFITSPAPEGVVKTLISQSGLFPDIICQSPTAIGKIYRYYRKIDEQGIFKALEAFRKNAL